MAIEDIQFEAEEHFEKSIGALENDFKRIRTGRATVGMVDHVQVEAYGAFMPLQQLANISVPEPQQLLIKPYDKSSLKDIERGLTVADLGMAPQSDGEVIRLNVPTLSGERRKEMVASANECSEKCRVAMRNARRDAIKKIEAEGKEDKLPEDLIKKSVEEVTELLKQYEGKVEVELKSKTDDLLKV